ALRDSRDHHAAVAMADEDHVPQVLELEHRDDILHMRVQVGVGARQVRALADAGERWREHLVAGRAQQWDDLPPAPAAVPAAVDKDEGHSAIISWGRPPRSLRWPERWGNGEHCYDRSP